jgi:tetratricopeptide (TPR) repeat protein
MSGRESCDEDVLIRYASGHLPPADRVDVDAHVRNCAQCEQFLSEMQRIVRSLHEGSTWSIQQTLARIRQAAMDREKDEGAAVDALLGLLEQSPDRWHEVIFGDERMRRHAVVRKLMDLTRAHFERLPTRAYELASLAADLADALPWRDAETDRLRSRAWSEKALALNDTGRYLEAISALEIADELSRGLPDSDHLAAITAYIRADVLRQIDRHDEALVNVRVAQATFERYGDTTRLVCAKILEANTIARKRDYVSAITIYRELLDRPDLRRSSATTARLRLNIGKCLMAIGETEAAGAHYQEAMRLFDEAGLFTERAKAEWGAARITIASGDLDSGLEGLRKVLETFRRLEMEGECILVEIEIIEARLLADEQAEVGDACRAVATRAASAGMASACRIATAYLRETACARRVTPDVARYVRIFIEDGPLYPGLPFDPPPIS